MEKRKLGKNRGVWCGKVLTEPEFSHEVKERQTGEIVERFYKFNVEAEIRDKKGNLIDLSVLPVTVPESKLNELEKKPEIGNIVFLKGSWRAYDYKSSETTRTHLEQNAYIKVIEVHEEHPSNTRNKFEFEGVLVKKLYEFERNENGVPVKDDKNRLIPKTDEEGNIKYVVRKNKEGRVVNDFIVAINRPNGSDYIPCIAYNSVMNKNLATFISKDIEVGSEVQGAGYIRARSYKVNGVERFAYEAVVTSLTVKEEEETKEQE